MLPLQNLSGDPNQEYLADGLTEARVTDLAQVRSLRVISRTSVMTYKGTKKKLPEIARELSVDAVVEGSNEAISELQETLRITPHNTAVMARLGYVLGTVGRKREALDLLKQMEREKQSEYNSAGLQAWIYAGIGDREGTLESVEKDENQRGTTTLFLRNDAKLDLVRSDPRFIALLKETHLDNN